MRKHILRILIIGIMLFSCACSTQNEENGDVLKVWMLNDNEQVREMLNTYQIVNSDVEIKIEIGVPDYDTTVSDALKKLNTRLMGGDGPDVMILDDVNVDAYVESGVLMELNGLNFEQMPVGVRENIYHNGEVYYVPTYLVLPVNLHSSNSDLDFTTLQQFNSDIQSKQLRVNYFEHLSALWYKTTIEPELISNEGIEMEQMQRFFIDLKALLEFVYGDAEESAFASYQQVNMQVNPLSIFLNIHLGALDCGKEYICSMTDLQTLCAMLERKEIDAEVCMANNSYMYIPMGNIAINANSKKQKEAKKLVEYLISEEGQLEFAGYGAANIIPVNKVALEKAMELSDEIRITYGNLGEYKTYPFSETGEKQVLSWIENLKYESATDGKLMEIVMLGAQSYLNGESTLENAVANTCQKMELYFNE